MGPAVGLPAVHKAVIQLRAMADVPLWPRKDRVIAASSEAVLFNQCLISPGRACLVGPGWSGPDGPGLKPN